MEIDYNAFIPASDKRQMSRYYGIRIILKHFHLQRNSHGQEHGQTEKRREEKAGKNPERKAR
jgi:hypothetical protein